MRDLRCEVKPQDLSSDEAPPIAAEAPPSARDIALGYIKRGWNPVPVPHRAKRPVLDEWQKLVVTADNASEYFYDDRPQNVGMILGPTSRGLTDVDCDSAESVTIAPYVLPRSQAIFGRESKRNSHYLYYTDIANAATKAVEKFSDPTTRAAIIELRTGGDAGAQTVFPGSTHEDTNEQIKWEAEGDPAPVSGTDLLRRVREVAAYSLLARHWPAAQGTRHDHALAVGGFLARCGKSPIEARNAGEAIACAAGDSEWRDRRKAMEDAAQAFRSGKNTCGYRTLRELYGDKIADKVAEWLGYGGSKDGDDQAQHEEGAAQFSATPYRWRDPKTIPPRPRLYGRYLSRKNISGTAAPGGVGKTTLGIAQAIELRIGRDIIGSGNIITGPLRVWYTILRNRRKN